jgi:hypothetical protein
VILADAVGLADGHLVGRANVGAATGEARQRIGGDVHVGDIELPDGRRCNFRTPTGNELNLFSGQFTKHRVLQCGTIPHAGLSGLTRPVSIAFWEAQVCTECIPLWGSEDATGSPIQLPATTLPALLAHPPTDAPYYSRRDHRKHLLPLAPAWPAIRQPPCPAVNAGFIGPLSASGTCEHSQHGEHQRKAVHDDLHAAGVHHYAPETAVFKEQVSSVAQRRGLTDCFYGLL